MAFADILEFTDWEKLYLTEAELGHRIDGDSWTQDGTYTNCWWIPHEDEGLPSKVTEDGSEYTFRSTLSEVNSNPSSWTYSYTTVDRLYVHTSGSDDPAGASNYIIVSKFWEYICNSQKQGDEIEFNNHYYLPYLNSDNMADIVQEVSDFYVGGTRSTFGALTYINTDGYFDERLSDYIYEGAKLLIKLGSRETIYADFATIWIGYYGNNYWSEDLLEFEIEDFRKE